MKCSQSAVQTIYFTHDQQRRHSAAPMTDIKLPAGYEDWTSPGNTPLRVPYIRITAERIDAPNTVGKVIAVHWLMPPKPKPVLPDVKPGAVISFKSRMGSERVAIRGNFGWRVFDHGVSVVYVGMNWAEPIATDADLLKDVGDEGFKLMVNPL